MLPLDKIEMREVARGDVDLLITSLRHADAVEMRAVNGCSLDDNVRIAAAVPSARVVTIGGDLVCMWGVTSSLATPDNGVPWMLGTTAIERHRMPFLRASRCLFAAMRLHHEHLINYVDARNVTAIRWLRWLGFDILPAVRYGVYGCLFHPFEWKR